MKVSCSKCLEECDTRRGRYCPKCGTVLPPRTDTGLRVEDECCKYDVLSALLFMHLCVNPKQSLSLVFSVTVVSLHSQHLYKPWAVTFVTTPLLPVIYLSAVHTDRASSQQVMTLDQFIKNKSSDRLTWKRKRDNKPKVLLYYMTVWHLLQNEMHGICSCYGY